MEDGGASGFNYGQQQGQNRLERSVSNKRSLSFGGRRKLSKGKCFAEAKKVDETASGQVTRDEFYRSTGALKKSKKKSSQVFKYV